MWLEKSMWWAMQTGAWQAWGSCRVLVRKLLSMATLETVLHASSWFDNSIP